MADSDAYACPLNLQFRQVVPFEEVDQVLDLPLLRGGVLGARRAGERPRQHDRGSMAL
jgi:hypothetical protein